MSWYAKRRGAPDDARGTRLTSTCRSWKDVRKRSQSGQTPWVRHVKIVHTSTLPNTQGRDFAASRGWRILRRQPPKQAGETVVEIGSRGVEGAVQSGYFPAHAKKKLRRGIEFCRLGRRYRDTGAGYRTVRLVCRRQGRESRGQLEAQRGFGRFGLDQLSSRDPGERLPLAAQGVCVRAVRRPRDWEKGGRAGWN